MSMRYKLLPDAALQPMQNLTLWLAVLQGAKGWAAGSERDGGCLHDRGRAHQAGRTA